MESIWLAVKAFSLGATVFGVLYLINLFRERARDKALIIKGELKSDEEQIENDINSLSIDELVKRRNRGRKP